MYLSTRLKGEMEFSNPVLLSPSPTSPKGEVDHDDGSTTDFVVTEEVKEFRREQMRLMRERLEEEREMRLSGERFVLLSSIHIHRVF